MADQQKARECKLRRCYECNRLEDQLWNTAYQEIWPLVRRRLAEQRGFQKREEDHQPATLAKGA